MAKPILCFYYLTYRCNARCSFCNIYERQGGFAEVKVAEEHIQQLANLGIRYIDFTGGEPLLHPDLPYLLKIAGEAGMHTSVTTNCLLYPRRAEKLKGLVDFLHFSLDGADAETHDAIRGVDCFNKVMESIEIAVKLGERPDILMTVTRENFNQIEAVLEIAQKNKLMVLINPVFDYNQNQTVDKELAEWLLKLPVRKYLYNNTAFLKMILNGGNEPEKPHCRAVSATIVISPQGRQLLPCFHHSVEELDLAEGIAGVRKSRIFRRALQKQGKYKFCRGCSINCYFDPSFLYKPDGLLIRSLIAKAKYAYDKFLTD